MQFQTLDPNRSIDVVLLNQFANSGIPCRTNRSHLPEIVVKNELINNTKSIIEIKYCKEDCDDYEDSSETESDEKRNNWKQKLISFVTLKTRQINVFEGRSAVISCMK